MVADVPRQVPLRRFPGSNVVSYYVIIIFIYNYTYNIVTYICIDLSKIQLFVFVFVFIRFRIRYGGTTISSKYLFGYAQLIQIQIVTAANYNSWRNRCIIMYLYMRGIMSIIVFFLCCMCFCDDLVCLYSYCFSSLNVYNKHNVSYSARRCLWLRWLC